MCSKFPISSSNFLNSIRNSNFYANKEFFRKFVIFLFVDGFWEFIDWFYGGRDFPGFQGLEVCCFA